jgi:hypothetical protein
MRRLVALGAVTALAVVPAAAQAKSHTKAKSHTTVLRGSFKLVGADGMYTTDSFGKAQLVDGKRNDSLSVHVRKLGRRTTYVFRLQSADSACAASAPGGTDVPGWRYRRGGVLKTNRHGVANSWARSHSFTASSTVSYFVGVWTTTAAGAPDQLVACAELKGNRKHTSHSHAPSHGHSGAGNKPTHGSANKPHGTGNRQPHGHRG